MAKDRNLLIFTSYEDHYYIVHLDDMYRYLSLHFVHIERTGSAERQKERTFLVGQESSWNDIISSGGYIVESLHFVHVTADALAWPSVTLTDASASADVKFLAIVSKHVPKHQSSEKTLLAALSNRLET
uniref:Uncharacterized protein n=1 Tax=Romanomermis culicivorax TaxID=13658 RepID=A0A915K471_ROMCU